MFALLPVTFKLLKRLTYNWISTKLLEVIPVEQAVFRLKRKCTDQVLSLTTYNEAEFQIKIKNAATFIDLTATFDTVLRVTSCKFTPRGIDIGQLLRSEGYDNVEGKNVGRRILNLNTSII